MTRMTLLASLALAMALPAGAQSVAGEGSHDAQAYWAARGRYADTAAYPRPEAMQRNLDEYNASYGNVEGGETFLRLHPIPQTHYGGPTVAGTIAASYADINSFRAGISEFEGELKAMSVESHEARADAPNRFLVAQGWRIVKAMAHAFNEDLVPGVNSLYQASTKGNQNLEILIEIAGGNNKLFDAGLPSATQLAGSQSELQLVEEVQRQHNAAAGERRQASGPIDAARAQIPGIYDKIVEYDRAYREYQRGVSNLVGAARQASDTLHKLSIAATTAQAADAALSKADRAEQQAIDAVRACTEGNIRALQNPKDAGAQTDARTLNQRALQKVREADNARQVANAKLGSPSMPGSVESGGTITQAARVHYRASDRVPSAAVRRSAQQGSEQPQLSATPDPGPMDQRP